MPKRIWVSKEHAIFRLENGDWYARPYIPGIGRREVSLGSGVDTLEKAIRAKNRKLKETIEAGIDRKTKRYRFEDFARQVIDLKRAKSSATFVSARLQIGKHLIPWFDKHCRYLADLNEGTWERYILDQYQMNPRRKLFNDRKHLTMIVQHARKCGVPLPAMRFRNPDPKSKRGKVYTDAEIQRLMLAAGKDLRLKILMAYTMGMRRKEIDTLRWEDIDLSQDTLTIRPENTKMRTGRTIAVSPEVRSILGQSERRSEFIFPAQNNPNAPVTEAKSSWRRCKVRAGVVGRFHDLRHTFLTLAFHKAKLPAMDICAYAGLDLATAKAVYLHPSVEQLRDVAKAVRFFGGKNGGSKE